MSRPYPLLIGLDDWITREPDYDEGVEEEDDPEYDEGVEEEDDPEYDEDDGCPECGRLDCECEEAPRP